MDLNTDATTLEPNAAAMTTEPNAATIKIAGSAVALISALKFEEIELLNQYRPNALSLRDDEKEIFCICTSERGHITKRGICFAEATRDESRFAQVTILMSANEKDAKEFAVANIGVALTHLRRVEKQAVEALAEVKKELDAVRSAVTVA